MKDNYHDQDWLKHHENDFLNDNIFSSQGVCTNQNFWKDISYKTLNCCINALPSIKSISKNYVIDNSGHRSGILKFN